MYKCLENTYTEEYCSLIDFSSLINLKGYDGDIKYFLLLNSGLLENINLKKDVKEDSFIKIISLKHLKEINFFININDEVLSKIKDENNSITKINLKLYDFSFNFFEFQTKFPNCEYLIADIFNKTHNSSSDKYEIECIEKPNFKLKKFDLKIHKNIKFSF